VLLNAATAHIRGFEGQFETHPGNFDFGMGVSWIPTAQYKSFPSGFKTVPKPGGGNNSVAPIDLSNTRMMRTPRFTVNASAGFHADFLGGTIRPSANILYNSGWVWWPGERLKQKEFVQLNAKLQWDAPGGRFNVFAYGENITGALRGVYEGTSNTGDAIAYDRPANVGFGIGFKY
jgi:iron complex outermembrane receptor protein